MDDEPDRPGDRRRSKVLFFAEAVTLAHVARPLALAKGLELGRYEVAFASAPRYEALWGDLRSRVRPIHSISGAQFVDALARGHPLYTAATLRSYVEEDLEAIREVRPDVIVGDFRLSLSVSARLAGIPYLTITNAYWSPYARQRFPLPELLIVRRLGLPLAGALFAASRPLAFALHTIPLNRIRREYGLPSLGTDLRRTYTDADMTLYADVPEMVPTFGLPPNHRYLGPIVWSPEARLPAWWDGLDPQRPMVYVTMGSSGRADLLSAVLEGLADLPVVVIAATLGRSLDRPAPPNALVADFLPGHAAAARADMVVCNGGSPTTHQALAAGVPVLGIPSNMDQHLNMQSVRRLGAGESIRSDRASAGAVRRAVDRILGDPRYTDEAARLAGIFSKYDAVARFLAIVDGLIRNQNNSGV
ncbi:MAG TPA: glycosyltransferase [Isosphaeraceae bacterium]